jgi:hypothetical protein
LEETTTDDRSWVWPELEASYNCYVDQQVRETIAAKLRRSGYTLQQFAAYLRRRPLLKKWTNPTAGLLQLAAEFDSAARNLPGRHACAAATRE